MKEDIFFFITTESERTVIKSSARTKLFDLPFVHVNVQQEPIGDEVWHYAHQATLDEMRQIRHTLWPISYPMHSSSGVCFCWCQNGVPTDSYLPWYHFCVDEHGNLQSENDNDLKQTVQT